MNPTRRELFGPAGALLALAVGCDRARERAPRAYPELTRSRASQSREPIVVGAFASLSGPDRAYGESLRRGFDLALADLARRGGIRGRELVLRTYDDQGLENGARAAGRRITSVDRAVALAGGSKRSLALAAAAEAREAAFVAATASPDDAQALGERAVGIAPAPSAQAKALWAHARDALGAKSASIVVRDGDPDSRELADAFARELVASGAPLRARVALTDDVLAESVLANAARADTSLSSSAPALDRLRAGSDVVLLALRGAEIARIARRVREISAATRIVCGVELDARGTWSADLEGARFATALAVAPEHALAREHRERFGCAIDGLAALGYDALVLVAAALAECDVVEREEVAAALGGARIARASSHEPAIAELVGGEARVVAAPTRR